MVDLDYWKFFAGLGLFLFGMNRVELTLREIAGRRFKLFLKKYTTNRVIAIVNGAVITALLQSSSVVILMVIAFAGAEIISLSNSLGVILGANLGTTVTGWLVTSFGFEFDFTRIIFPLLAVGSVGQLFGGWNRIPIVRNFLVLMVSFGLLLMGLTFMKDSMNQFASLVHFEGPSQLSLFFYFIIGFGVTAIMQSSSATMTITLSALYAQLITLVPAAFVVIGADLGTTTTGLIASMRGSAIKKRVGFAHFLFNLVSNTIAILLAKPLLEILQASINITNPLYTLVAFHSLFNLIGIILFVPFLGTFENLLNHFFQGSDTWVCRFIHRVNVDMPDAALVAVRLDLKDFLGRVIDFHLKMLDPSLVSDQVFNGDDSEQDYDDIKRFEGEVLEYFVSLQKEKLDENESKMLNQFSRVLRDGVQSAKSIKDVKHNLSDFAESVVAVVEQGHRQIVAKYLPILPRIQTLAKAETRALQDEKSAEISQSITECYTEINRWIYSVTTDLHSAGQEVATFLNVNREIYLAYRFLLSAHEGLSETIS